MRTREHLEGAHLGVDLDERKLQLEGLRLARALRGGRRVRVEGLRARAKEAREESLTLALTLTLTLTRWVVQGGFAGVGVVPEDDPNPIPNPSPNPSPNPNPSRRASKRQPRGNCPSEP